MATLRLVTESLRTDLHEAGLVRRAVDAVKKGISKTKGFLTGGPATKMERLGRLQTTASYNASPEYKRVKRDAQRAASHANSSGKAISYGRVAHLHNRAAQLAPDEDQRVRHLAKWVDASERAGIRLRPRRKKK